MPKDFDSIEVIPEVVYREKPSKMPRKSSIDKKSSKSVKGDLDDLHILKASQKPSIA